MNFIKAGRIYWIKPKPTPGMKAKVRPAIALAKYDNGKTIFLHLGSSKFSEPQSLAATIHLRKFLDDSTFRKTRIATKTYVHLDASKPEWNTSIIKPHHKDGYIDLDHRTAKKLRAQYYKRKSEVENIWMKKAKIAIINEKYPEAEKFIEMIKDKDPIKHSNLDAQNWIEKNKEML